MKIGLKPENPLEALGPAPGLVPRPMEETLPPLLLTRALMAAARFGIIEALADGSGRPARSPHVETPRGASHGTRLAHLLKGHKQSLPGNFPQGDPR